MFCYLSSSRPREWSSACPTLEHLLNENWKDYMISVALMSKRALFFEGNAPEMIKDFAPGDRLNFSVWCRGD